MKFNEAEKVSLYLDGLILIEDASSDLQKVQLYKHDQLGKVLIINDEIQHVENWIPYYHESITHIPMIFIPKVEKVLILGGGDLYAAAEVLKYSTVTKVVLCDYDKNVIDLTKKYYEHGERVLSDKRFNPVICDAKDYIAQCDEKFDLIIDDCFNLVDAFEDEYIFNLLKDMLTDVGVCSSLVYRHVFDTEVMLKTNNRLLKRHHTVLSLVTVPEYPGVLHVLTMWGKSKYMSQNLTHSMNIEHNEKFNKLCNLFDSRFCKFYLYLPSYLKSLL